MVCTVARSSNAPPFTLRSIRNPVSVVELSVQARSTWEVETTVAVSPDGAGTDSVAAEAVPEGDEQPASLHARTR